MKRIRTLSNINKPVLTKRNRESSFDRMGGNKDYYMLEKGEEREIFNETNSGTINHIWMTLRDPHKVTDFLPRKIVIRMYWDDEEHPSVEVPVGDFFGMGHGMTKNFVSAPFQMSPEDGKAFNCWFPMSFNKARITIENQSDSQLQLYFYIDYDEHELDKDDNLRFHAYWYRELTDGIDDEVCTKDEFNHGGYNTTGEDNYVILHAKGKGHYVGVNLNIHNLLYTLDWNWYGEGDDMIFVDGEAWPPKLHGTGNEDYFNTAWCPTQEYNAPYHGIILPGEDNWSNKISLYRYHILDPIPFEKEIKVTIEHGHNNNRSDDYSSTAYWYQTEPHMQYSELSAVDKRLPLKEKTLLQKIPLWIKKWIKREKVNRKVNKSGV